MALTTAEIIRVLLPNIGLIANGDALATYRLGVEDVNSDEILVAVEAMQVDLAALEVINAAILADGTVTMAHTDPAIGSSTTLALAENTDREYAMFINDSDETIYLKIGVDAVLNAGIRLNSGGGSYEMSRKIGNLDVRVVNGICASGSKELLVTEGV